MSTGQFVPVTEWTCPEHDWPHDHECDCEHCDRRWDCEQCATADWRETGEMRELSPLEVALRAMPRLEAMQTLLHHSLESRLEWLEDQLFPRINHQTEGEGA